MQNTRPQGAERKMGSGLHLNQPQPPHGQADTPSCSPSAARSRPASARQDEGRRPPQSKGKLSHLGVCRRKGQCGGSRRGQGACAGEGVTEGQAGLCSGPRGARRRHPPSIAAGLKGKHKTNLVMVSVSLAQEKGEEGERLGGGAGGTGKRCENG